MRAFCLLLVALIAGSLPDGCGPGGISGNHASGDAPLQGGVVVPFENEMQLWTAYGGDNEAAIDAKATGKVIEFLIRGKVIKDESGEYVAASWVVDPPPAKKTPNVICHFAAQDRDKLTGLESGKAFKIRGYCQGKQPDKEAWGGYAVTVTGCRVAGVMVWKDNGYVKEGK